MTAPLSLALRLADHDGRLASGDRDAGPYRLIPVHVPSGTLGLVIRLTYAGRDLPSHDPSAAIVDLGLLQPAAADDAGSTFRGWSGSERHVVAVGSQRSTPGYRTGALLPGAWSLILGLYRLPPAGVPYRLTVDAVDQDGLDHALLEAQAAWVADHPEATANRRSPMPSRPPLGVDGWLRCDLHAHSRHSDGVDDPARLAQSAAEVGLDALFLTDHNTDSHLRDVAAAEVGAVLLAGEEVTTYRGHLNALGVGRWVDFRFDDDAGLRRALDRIHAQGGVASANHPRGEACTFDYAAVEGLDAVEVWNGPWGERDAAALAWWDELLRRGLRPAAVGGSDAHSMDPDDQPLGTPVTWIAADRVAAAPILDALRGRRAVVSRDASGPFVELSVGHERGPELGRTGDMVDRGDPSLPLVARWRVRNGAGCRLHLLTGAGPSSSTALATDDQAGAWPWSPAPSGSDFVRLEVRHRDGSMAALSNPIFLEGPA